LHDFVCLRVDNRQERRRKSWVNLEGAGIIRRFTNEFAFDFLIWLVTLILGGSLASVHVTLVKLEWGSLSLTISSTSLKFFSRRHPLTQQILPNIGCNRRSRSILTTLSDSTSSCASRSFLSEMPAAAAGHPPPSFKMEDRKRSLASTSDDYAPPTKRQAVNGNRSSTNDDLPWKDDLEVCQVTRHQNTFHQNTNHISSPFPWVCDISEFFTL
jgi:hypothetical protein